MNRLIIIGNGFDIAHGFKTSYKDFINWYCNQRIDSFVGNTTKVSKDCLCKITIKEKSDISCWNVFSHQNNYFREKNDNRQLSGYDIIQDIKNHSDIFTFECSLFFSTLLQSIETKGWVDIENDYYQLLKKCIDSPQCNYTINELNTQDESKGQVFDPSINQTCPRDFFHSFLYHDFQILLLLCTTIGIVAPYVSTGLLHQI